MLTVGKRVRKESLGTPNRGWKDNIKMKALWHRSRYIPTDFISLDDHNPFCERYVMQIFLSSEGNISAFLDR